MLHDLKYGQKLSFCIFRLEYLENLTWWVNSEVRFGFNSSEKHSLVFGYEVGENFFSLLLVTKLRSNDAFSLKNFIKHLQSITKHSNLLILGFGKYRLIDNNYFKKQKSVWWQVRTKEDKKCTASSLRP